MNPGKLFPEDAPEPTGAPTHPEASPEGSRQDQIPQSEDLPQRPRHEEPPLE